MSPPVLVVCDCTVTVSPVELEAAKSRSDVPGDAVLSVVVIAPPAELTEKILFLPDVLATAKPILAVVVLH